MKKFDKLTRVFSGLFSAVLMAIAPYGLEMAHAAPGCFPIVPVVSASQLGTQSPMLLTDSATGAYLLHLGNASTPSLVARNVLTGVDQYLDPVVSGPLSDVTLFDAQFDGQRYRILFNDSINIGGGNYIEHHLKLFTSNGVDLAAGGTVVTLVTSSTTSGLNSIDHHRVARGRIDNGYIVYEMQHRTGPFWAEVRSSDLKVAPLSAPTNASLVITQPGVPGNFEPLGEAGALSDGTVVWTQNTGVSPSLSPVIKAKNAIANPTAAPIQVSPNGVDVELDGIIERRILGADIYTSRNVANSTISATLLPTSLSVPFPGVASFRKTVISDLASPFSATQFMAISRGTPDAKIQTLEALPKEMSLAPAAPGQLRRVLGISGSIVLEEVLTPTGGGGYALSFALHACVG